MFELCYKTPRGTDGVRHLHDAASAEKMLKSFAGRHIACVLYRAGNRDRPVGAVYHSTEWYWWFDPARFNGNIEQYLG